MEESVYRAIAKLLSSSVKEWKIKGGLGYVLAMIEDFVDDHDAAFTYAYGKEE